MRNIIGDIIIFGGFTAAALLFYLAGRDVYRLIRGTHQYGKNARQLPGKIKGTTRWEWDNDA